MVRLGDWLLLVIYLVICLVTNLPAFAFSESIKPWWEWAFSVSPLSYGQRVVSVNEFSAERWMKVYMLMSVLHKHKRSND